MKTFSNKVLTKPEAEQALDTAIALVRRNLPLYTDHCQNHSSVHDISSPVREQPVDLRLLAREAG